MTCLIVELNYLRPMEIKFNIPARSVNDRLATLFIAGVCCHQMEKTHIFKRRVSETRQLHIIKKFHKIRIKKSNVDQ